MDKGVMEAILRQINETGGAGITLPGGPYIPRPDGMPLMAFAKSIARGTYEVPTSKETAVPSEPETEQHNRRLDEQRAAEIGASESISSVEINVEEYLQSQISKLREQLDAAHRSLEQTQDFIEITTLELQKLEGAMNAYGSTVPSSVPAAPSSGVSGNTKKPRNRRRNSVGQQTSTKESGGVS